MIESDEPTITQKIRAKMSFYPKHEAIPVDRVDLEALLKKLEFYESLPSLANIRTRNGR